MDDHSTKRWQGAATADDEGQRLDRVLARRIETMCRARLQALIREGRVSLGGEAVRDPNRKLRAGEEIAVSIPEIAPAPLQGEPIPLTIIYEDEALIVIDKPPGLVVHPGAGIASGTLVNALIAHCGASLSGIGGVARPGIVHRLDKDTSGLMVVAKTDEVHYMLSAQFADHGRSGDLRREYLALVWGCPMPLAGRIETLVGRHPSSRVKMAVLTAGGRRAITHYAVENTYNNPKLGIARKNKLKPGPPLASLVRCRLETGRTHQVRLHMAHKGTPVIADPLYGGGFGSSIRGLPVEVSATIMNLERQALHAALLTFRHPATGRLMTFNSELPGDMKKVREALETLNGTFLRI